MFYSYFFLFFNCVYTSVGIMKEEIMNGSGCPWFTVKITLEMRADPGKGKGGGRNGNLSMFTFYIQKNLLNSTVNCYWIK